MDNQQEKSISAPQSKPLLVIGILYIVWGVINALQILLSLVFMDDLAAATLGYEPDPIFRTIMLRIFIPMLVWTAFHIFIGICCLKNRYKPEGATFLRRLGIADIVLAVIVPSVLRSLAGGINGVSNFWLMLFMILPLILIGATKKIITAHEEKLKSGGA